jgi:outer membrane lipoprotein SlyB
MNTKLILAFSAAILLGACASGKSADVYTRDQVRQVQTFKVGVIDSVREVLIEGTQSQVGTTAGAVVGGIAGSSASDGKTGEIAAILGGVFGGMLGAAAEEGYTREDALEIAIKLEDGSYISVVQAKSISGETFAVGDKVRVIENAGVTRVTH